MDRTMEETKKILRSLLLSSRKKLNVHQLNDDHKEMVGYDIPYKDLGYRKLLDFLRDIPDVLKVNGNSLTSEVNLLVSDKIAHLDELLRERPTFYNPPPSGKKQKMDTERISYCGDFKQPQSPQKYPSHDFLQENSQFQSDDSDFTGRNNSDIGGEKLVYRLEIPKKVQDDLKKLIEVFPKGIRSNDLLYEYKRKFRRVLRLKKFGYSSVIDMCKDLENIFHWVEESKGLFKLYDARKQIPKIAMAEDNQVEPENRTSFEPNESLELPSSDSKLDTQLFPRDAVGHGLVIKRDFVKQREIDNYIFSVVVAEIYHPSTFWLFRDDGRLDALIDAMQPFYSKNKDRYRIPEQFLETGLYCVGVVMKQFRRCVIVQMIPDFFLVHVFCIDYGTLGIVPRTEVMFLTNEFTRLPAQAIRARLANVRPSDEFAMWTSEARDRFKELADMKHLVAIITKVSKEDKIIEVYLENHIAAPGRDIGTMLVNEGFAVNENDNHHSNRTPSVKNHHFTPDFVEIENWNAPSFKEMIWFSNKDQSDDHRVTQFFEIQEILAKREEKPIKDMDTFNPHFKEINEFTDKPHVGKDSKSNYPERGSFLEVIRNSARNCLNSSLPQDSRDSSTPGYHQGLAKPEGSFSADSKIRQLDKWVDLSALEKYISKEK